MISLKVGWTVTLKTEKELIESGLYEKAFRFSTPELRNLRGGTSILQPMFRYLGGKYPIQEFGNEGNLLIDGWWFGKNVVKSCLEIDLFLKEISKEMDKESDNRIIEGEKE